MIPDTKLKQGLRMAGAKFKDGQIVYHANTCDPLTAAADRGDIKMNAISRSTYPGQRLHKSQLPGLCSLGYWDAGKKQSWGLDWHRNEGIEIAYVASGTIDFCVEDKKYELSAGDLTITRPWQEHKLGDPNLTENKLLWIIIDVDVRQPHSTWKWPDWLILSKKDIKELTRFFQLNEDPVIRGNKEIGLCFEKLQKLIDANDPNQNESRLTLCINELLISIHSFLKEEKRPLDDSLIQADRTVKLFLNTLEHQLDVDWSLESMALRCELGRTRFSHYCRKLTNKTPLVYLNHLRIQKAAKLLKETALSAQEISNKCGFNSNQYFSTQFKKFFKMTPHSFRNSETK
ncbi:MAG: AraC family transcriptional regulator [Lentisphaeraceae bacterium]|nr:AraC family transcriptional regulator [Lentisphaeraceae bacterium]